MSTTAMEWVALRASDDPNEARLAVELELPEAVWREVIARFPGYKEQVLLNKRIPMSILELLVTDPDPRVRRAVARKRKATPELLRRLAADPDIGVRDHVAWNPKTPDDVLRRLAADPVDHVAQSARRRLVERGLLPASEMRWVLAGYSRATGLHEVDLPLVGIDDATLHALFPQLSEKPLGPRFPIGPEELARLRPFLGEQPVDPARWDCYAEDR